MLARIKKNDKVVVLSGRDKGKQGHVVTVDTKKQRLLVKDVCMVTRHIKAKQQGETSRISREESYIPSFKVMPICPACKKPCRIIVRQLEARGGTSDNKKVRACHRCKEAF